ncbi:hypothetical protein [Rhizobium sp. NPDC090279]|uniref:hypothetical protein n=1 Tax=Rhizobium sp. NPDC090279 TaxID=3364499 RepID=UPI00383B726F
MFKMPKPTIMFAVLGTTFTALAVSSVPSFAALSCVESLQLTGVELRDAPMDQQKRDAMGLYSAAIDAHRNRQEGRCEGDLDRVDGLLARTASSADSVDSGNVGLFTSSTSQPTHGDGHDHGHGGGHDRH